jgi:hypothetical protein
MKALMEHGLEDEAREFKREYRTRYGSLPRNATEGGLGGRVHVHDAKRRRDQEAFDNRWGTRIALDTGFGSSASESYGTTSEATMDRWDSTHLR